MIRPDARQLFAAMEATWPPARAWVDGPVTLRDGRDGGNRVSAATAGSEVTVAAIQRAEVAMTAMGQPSLWMIRPGDDALEAHLEARGYRPHEPVVIRLAPVATFAKPPPVAAFALWPPLAIQREIWAAGGIGPERIEIMARVAVPKAALLARSADRPAGAAFVAVADGIAMLHALTVPSELRRNGAARAIMLQAAAWAAATGADWLALAVGRDNTAANGLYASLGMAVVEQYRYRIL